MEFNVTEKMYDLKNEGNIKSPVWSNHVVVYLKKCNALNPQKIKKKSDGKNTGLKTISSGKH